jgi:ubiquitin C-terminal hydrolase
VKGKKQLEFEKAPKVLAVCLKRFEFTISGSIKIEDPVENGGKNSLNILSIFHMLSTENTYAVMIINYASSKKSN